MNNHELIVLMFCIIITGLAVRLWHVLCKPKVKPRVAICAKCKYAVKTRWWQARIQIKFRCRTPDDPTPTNFVTGVISKPTFTCDLRNGHGTCVNYKKAWWRR